MEYIRTLPKHLVHRRSVAEVFLTDYCFDPSSDYCKVAVQLPIAHRMFDSTVEQDPLCVAEAFRQAVVLLGHTRYDIPLHYRFLMETFGVELFDALDAQVSTSPATIVLTVNTISHRAGAVSGVGVSGVFSSGAREVARCYAVARGVDPEGYRRIRQGRDIYSPTRRTIPENTEVLTPDRVGRHLSIDVLISTDVRNQTMFCTPDPGNTALFDHPVDHIPGMVLFEAARQALRVRTGNPAAQIRALSASFPRYTEWETPCSITISRVHVDDHGADMHRVRFTQNGALTAELEID
jgi:2-oxo-3-(phosphooxy)propyl 3-oxoalkanoate synthase